MLLGSPESASSPSKWSQITGLIIIILEFKSIHAWHTKMSQHLAISKISKKLLCCIDITLSTTTDWATTASIASKRIRKKPTRIRRRSYSYRRPFVICKRPLFCSIRPRNLQIRRAIHRIFTIQRYNKVFTLRGQCIIKRKFPLIISCYCISIFIRQVEINCIGNYRGWWLFCSRSTWGGGWSDVWLVLGINAIGSAIDAKIDFFWVPFLEAFRAWSPCVDG
jgi:hypothetical protein